NGQGNIYFGHSGGTADGRIEYSHQADYMRFFTANDERLRIDSSGRVGIGTNTMDSSAEVSITNASSSARVYMKSADNADCSIYFGSMNDSATGAIRYDHSDDSLRLYGYNNSERLRIKSDGKVGINQDTPTAQLQIGHPNSATGVLRADPNYFSIDSGYVPGGSQGGVVGSATTAALIFGGDANTGLYHSASDTLNFTTGGTERLRINSSGKFCFGTYNSNFASNDGIVSIVNAASSGTENPLLTLWNPTTVVDSRAG
ncbi:MAG: hypothetical protein VXY93_14635, partial [Pseudomonadota bacterium]|nr:hypothetical protein [Pseudomonadota bacterium]